MKSLAILVLNYNGKHFLEECFTSLQNQTSTDFDTYLVDNDSHDNSRQFSQEKFKWVNVVNTGDNLGFTGAYNFISQKLIKEHKQYQYYLLLNNDTNCDADLVKEILKTFGDYEKVGIVVPAVVDKNLKIDSLGGKFLFLTGTTLGNKSGETYQKGNNVYKCFWASGCALTIRSDLFQKLGYFDNYFIFYEDVDISWRVNNAGWEVVGIDSTYVIHYGGGSKLPSNFSLFLSEKNRVITYWQNLPHFVFWPLLPFFLTSRLVLLFYISRSPSNVWTKLKGLIVGIFLIPRFKKRIFKINDHLNTIKNMNTIINLK